MALRTSNQSGDWSDTSTWVGGVLPADGDDVVIAAGHSVKMNVNLSAWTGIYTLTIQGSSGTPGMLYWMDGSSGVLKLRNTVTSCIISGTTGTNKGRLLINSDGVWGNTGNLAFATKAIIMCYTIDCTYLDVRTYCAEPTYKSVRAYVTKNTVTASGDVFTGATLTSGQIVHFKTSGTLPAPLVPDTPYKAVETSGNTFKVIIAYATTDTAPITLTSTGTGTHEVYIPFSTTTLTVDTDLTTDSFWTTTTDHNIVLVLSGYAANSYKRQVTTLTNITSTTITVAAMYSGIEAPAYVVLLSRNVSFRFYQGTSTGSMPNMVGTHLEGEFRATTSTGAIPASFSSTFTKNVSGITIKKGIVSCYTTIVELRPNNTITELSAISVAGNYVCVANYTPVSTPYNADIAPGLTVSGDVYIATVFFGLSSAIFTGNPYSVITLFHTCADISYTKNLTSQVELIFSNCTRCSYTGTIKGTRILVTSCFDCLMIGDVYNFLALFTSYSDKCTFVGDLYNGQMISSNALGLELKNTFIGTVSDSVINHCLHGFLELVNSTVSFPLKFTAANLIIQGVYTQGIYIKNCNSDASLDGLYTPVGNIKKVYAGQYAYVPSTSYDGINDFLMVDGFTSDLTQAKYLKIIKNMQFWCEAGARTLRFYLVSTFTTLSGNDLHMRITYIDSDGHVVLTSNAVPSTATNWSQYIEKQFTKAEAGFITIDIYLRKYESGARLFVHPWPVVT